MVRLLPVRTVLIASLLAVAGCAPGEDPADPTEQAAAEGSVDLAAVQEIGRIQAEASAEQIRLDTLEERYEARAGEPLPVEDLSPNQAAVLSDIIAAEQDPDLKGLLQSIVDSREVIQSLRDELVRVRERLPSPSIVEPGDTHFGLAVEWLVSTHGLADAEAEALVRRTLLADRLEPGMEVWHFYDAPVYAAAVTQGSAARSPHALLTGWVHGLEEDRDAARAQAAAHEARADRMELEAVEAMKARNQALDALDAAARHRDRLSDERAQFRYRTSSVRELREDQLLPPIGLRLRAWRPDLLDESLDTRRSGVIRVDAEQLDLRRIRHVELLPVDRWQKDVDYRVIVAKDGAAASVILLDPQAFGGEEAFVVAR